MSTSTHSADRNFSLWIVQLSQAPVCLLAGIQATQLAITNSTGGIVAGRCLMEGEVVNVYCRFSRLRLACSAQTPSGHVKAIVELLIASPKPEEPVRRVEMTYHDEIETDTNDDSISRLVQTLPYTLQVTKSHDAVILQCRVRPTSVDLPANVGEAEVAGLFNVSLEGMLSSSVETGKLCLFIELKELVITPPPPSSLDDPAWRWHILESNFLVTCSVFSRPASKVNFTYWLIKPGRLDAAVAGGMKTVTEWSDGPGQDNISAEQSSIRQSGVGQASFLTPAAASQEKLYYAICKAEQRYYTYENVKERVRTDRLAIVYQ
ncbi:unnamed protein product [Protopolystoma xenopodis]|uniref:Uncharacterized protein n=1 Tax=Protopolystoma xenopodis TaxID=117903 RepID=A0A3S5FBK0_9PLAT|nr:unnamed protein product [Protopolystoma xenopodis]